MSNKRLFILTDGKCYLSLNYETGYFYLSNDIWDCYMASKTELRICKSSAKNKYWGYSGDNGELYKIIKSFKIKEVTLKIVT